MGVYANKIVESHKARRLSAEQIRTAKNQRSHARNVERQARKRAEAEKRQAVRDKRSASEQLAVIAGRRGNSLRESGRLVDAA